MRYVFLLLFGYLLSSGDLRRAERLISRIGQRFGANISSPTPARRSNASLHEIIALNDPSDLLTWTVPALGDIHVEKL